MYNTIYKKISLSVISVFFFYSMTTVGGTASYVLDISSDNVKGIIDHINEAKPVLTISSIKEINDKTGQKNAKNFLLTIDMTSLKMQSMKKALVIKSLNYDSNGLSKPVKVSFSKKRKASNNMSSAITINSIKSQKESLLVNISCLSDGVGQDKFEKKNTRKLFGSSRKSSMNKGSRNPGPDNYCGLIKNKKLFVTFQQ